MHDVPDRERCGDRVSFNLRQRSFLKETDFSPKEWKFLLGLAADLKAAKYAGTEQPRLVGKNIALSRSRPPGPVAPSRWPRTTKVPA